MIIALSHFIQLMEIDCSKVHWLSETRGPPTCIMEVEIIFYIFRCHI